jgi:Ca2+-binding RTX toxin-like protein
VLTDQPDVVLGDHGFVDRVLADGDPTDLDRIWSTDPALGGNDTITTGRSGDVVIGGVGADHIVASDGRNLVLGDSGRVTADQTQTLRWDTLALSPMRLETADPTTGGADTITTGSGLDVVLGGAGNDWIDLGAGTDIGLGDHGFVLWHAHLALAVDYVTISDNAIGGSDVIYGRDGEDLLVGGAAGDDIDGGTGRDLIFGDNVTLDRQGSFGDHTSPRFRLLSGTALYSTDLATAGNALVGTTCRTTRRPDRGATSGSRCSTTTGRRRPTGASGTTTRRWRRCRHDLRSARQ